MADMTPHPARLQRVGAIAIRTALWVVACAWLVLGIVWVALHFVIVPRIADFRPALEQQASRWLGITVRIGNIAARSNGFIPSLDLTNVRLLDTQGREALKLPTVLAALSARSLMGLGLEQLTIDSPEIDVRRAKDGRIWIAGLPLTDAGQTDSRITDWVFSQPELVIRHGRVLWTDEMRDAPPLALTDVDWVLRNQNRRHAMRLDASPPEHWGARMSLTAIFKQPLLARRSSLWKEWDGQLYANFVQVDLGALRRYADLGVNLTEGTGSVRAWVDVVRGSAKTGTADMALDSVVVTVSPKLGALGLKGITGRLGAKSLAGGMEFSTQSLQFETNDGLRWPGGNLRLAVFDADTRKPARGEFLADRLDLAALSQIALRLPLDESWHHKLSQLAAQGLVQQIQGTWEGPTTKPTRFAVSGRILQLGFAPMAAGSGFWPGLRGADVFFDATHSGGRAGFSLQGGSLDLPGVFGESRLPWDTFVGDLQWKTEGTQVSIHVPNLRFSNPDLQGEAQVQWKTGSGPASTRFPGVLDLQASLSRADGTKVHRYLPLGMNPAVREYVRDAVLAGQATSAKFKVKGNLSDFPFDQKRQGEFRIAADITGATLAYIPASLLPKDSTPWPVLAQLSGELVIDNTSLQVKGAHAEIVGAPELRLAKVDAVIEHLYGTANLTLNAEAQGPLPDLLNLIKGSPLNAMMGSALARATASGAGDYRFKLQVPLASPERTTVRGTISLVNNELQVTPDTPRLTKAKAVIGFSENGFSVVGGAARALGGDVRIEGGLSSPSAPPAPPTVKVTSASPAPQLLRLQGTATAEGLRQARELGVAARLAQYAQGSASYNASLGFRGGVTELMVTSNLVGLGISLPAPFGKTPEASVAARLETSAVRASLLARPDGTVRAMDQLQFEFGRAVSIAYVRDVSGVQARALRGAIAVGLVGDEVAPLASDGISANVNMASIDVDAWTDVLARITGTDRPTTNTGADDSAIAMAYLPTSIALRAKDLTAFGRNLHNVVMGGGREGLLWRANLDATELNGYVEYRQPSGSTDGRLYGRLSRLIVGQSVVQDVETVLDRQPASIPALDIVVDDLELRGKKLGHIEIDAVNLGASASAAARDMPREWRLNRFNITTPEAMLTASGNWTDIAAQAPMPTLAAGASIQQRRRTVMNFKLDIHDSGELLSRFGMTGVVRRGQGKIDGQVAWAGSPITPDYPSLNGSFKVNVERGQFLQSDPGIGKLLGVLSLQALPRRLTLDFQDVFSEGFAFDFFRGDVNITQGIARTNNLQMKGVNGAALMEGEADIAKETQNIKVVVVPEINAGSASLLATYINPVVGLTTFLAQMILRKPLIEAATQELLIDGTWLEPRVSKVGRKSTAPAQNPESK